MSNETDLDWLARNVHVWPAGDHQPWCYVYWKGGHRAVSANCITVIQSCARIEKADWLARRAELQNKPSWGDAPEWAEWLAQDEDGEWKWLAGLPGKYVDGWTAVKIKGCCKGLALGDWRDTLEKRPEQDEFEPFVSIEDSQGKEMKQDNKWFERGELPPVGVVCEAYLDYPPQWIEAEIVAHKDGFAIGWCKSVMKGCHGDKPSEFRPIRTERDKLVELIKTYRHTFRSDTEFADAILAAGFKRGAA